MASYKAYLTCECNEKSLIDAFRLLYTAFHKEAAEKFSSRQELACEFSLSKRTNAHDSNAPWNPQNDPLEIDRFLGLEQNVRDQYAIVFTIKVGDDIDLDVFSYRYLFLIINQLLRKQDQLYLNCPDTYYHKVGSYFFLQTLLPDQKVSFQQKDEDEDGNKAKTLPQIFSLSSEWFPAIYLSSQDSELYDVLANPLFKQKEELRLALKTHMPAKDANRLDFKQGPSLRTGTARDRYISCLKRYFTNWLNGMLKECPIEDRLCNAPGIAQLLFAVLCKNFGKKPSKLNQNEIETLLDICCDFADCILQVAENIVNHTEGGVLSIRINNNWEKIKDAFQTKDSVTENRWYMRISLVDFSSKSILDTVREKSEIYTLTLPHIFMEESVPDDILPEEYQRIAQAYNDYLNDSEHIIHHYGLAVFRNVVNQYGGCFTVKSDAGNTGGNAKRYTLDSDKITYVHADDTAHIPGSEYDILLPLDRDLLKRKKQRSNPSLLLKPKYIVPSVSRKIQFEEDIYDHFNKPLSDKIRSIRKTGRLQNQQLKEYVVSVSAQELVDKLLASHLGQIKDNVFYFYLSDITEQIFGRAEIVAKIILQTIAELKKRFPPEEREQEWLYIVLYGLSESKLVQFTRQFALFYHRHGGNQLMNGCRLYAVSGDYQAEVMFAGVELRAISDYSKSRRLVTGTASGISDILTHIAGRHSIEESTANRQDLEAFPFELLNRIEQVNTDKGVALSPHNKWYHQNLETILHNDIHGGDLGCRLNNVHVRVGNVHLHTFFEGQLLFANMYWYQIFAHYICETVLNDPKIDKDQDVLLYGYETYAEQMLFAAMEKLKKSDYRAHYAVFENPKYITSAETSEQRVRYVDGFLNACGEKICVVYVLGIGTTLATMSERMNAELKRAFKTQGKEHLLNTAYKKGIVVVQVSGGPADKDIRCNRDKYTVSSNMADLSFLSEQVCHYLVEAQTKWYPAQKCPYCLHAKDYHDELPLIQTNETSTVPMTLIKPTKYPTQKIRFKQTQTYSEEFLKGTNSAAYLYYSHLNRAGNHYQFYIRTAALLNDYLQYGEPKLDSWFKEIKEKEVIATQANLRRSQINIIVSPLHFSDEALVAAINDGVFNGEAYIIHFDVKKEFRDSFVAKFQNYHSALEMLIQDGMGDGLELNFYYVDDIILTGATFNRARSLVSSMLGEFWRGLNTQQSGITINLFKGIILLVNRNSKETLCNYFAPTALEQDEGGNLLLPVYSFIELNTPAIRSYGDSCPICNKVERIRLLEEESSLTYVERHWREKAEYHGLKKLSDAKHDKKFKNDEHGADKLYQTRGLRRLQCSEMIWALLKENKLTNENAKDILEQEIDRYLHRLKRPEKQIEYLISFLKIISREHVVFQEAVQPAALKILLSIFSVFIESSKTTPDGLYKTVYTLIHDKTLCQSASNLPYALYQLVIARLCTMGSTVFCRKNQLKACLQTGLRLEKEGAAPKGTPEESFSSFLCIQIKKMLFATQDCAFRVKELQKVLKSCIAQELKSQEVKADGRA